ncbi:hypothetical protein ERO13_A05G354150v2 [Gossypium hirsutum]|uniref:Uncharacterized protein n=1 Tax=Gossypium darwinii TaxID=34276 RepID=A0A5D2GQ10_GOSDA|nr:hypothetical protein ERO13_A05G354150v2 [Gossypium hirsutum]TYH20012.1 hypothetical protein ES288_A05G398200v1 [Gossypium darwinii]
MKTRMIFFSAFSSIQNISLFIFLGLVCCSSSWTFSTSYCDLKVISRFGKKTPETGRACQVGTTSRV